MWYLKKYLINFVSLKSNYSLDAGLMEGAFTNAEKYIDATNILCKHVEPFLDFSLI